MVFDPVFAEDGEEEEGRLEFISDAGVMLPTGAVLLFFGKREQPGIAWLMILFGKRRHYLLAASANSSFSSCPIVALLDLGCIDWTVLSLCSLKSRFMLISTHFKITSNNKKLTEAKMV